MHVQALRIRCNTEYQYFIKAPFLKANGAMEHIYINRCFFCPVLWLSAPVFPADRGLSDPCGRVPHFQLCWGQWLHQRPECPGHAHGGGLRVHESSVCDSGEHGFVLLPRTGPDPPALQCLSQKPLLQRRPLCGHSAWLQVSKWCPSHIHSQQENTSVLFHVTLSPQRWLNSAGSPLNGLCCGIILLF